MKWMRAEGENIMIACNGLTVIVSSCLGGFAAWRLGVIAHSPRKVPCPAVILLGLCVFACWTLPSVSVAAEPTPHPRAVVIQTGGDFPTELATVARAAGYDPRPIPPESLAKPESLKDRCDLLILPNAGAVPYDAFPGIQAHLKSGGAVLALGGPLWPAPAVRVGGRSTSRTDWQRELAATKPQHRLLDLRTEDLKRWSRHSYQPGAVGSYRIVDAPTGPSLHVSVADMNGWDNLVRDGLKFEKGQLLTCFRAKGGRDTRQLGVEWAEKDGSRWIATVDLSPEWRSYTLAPSAFKAWPPDDGRRRLNVADATRFSVGLSNSHTPQVGRGPHQFWFADLATAAGRDLDPNSEAEFPVLLSLSPWHQFYPIHGPVVAHVSDLPSVGQVTDLPSAGKLATCPMPLLALHSRATAAGFDKDRPWRWQSLVEARSPEGEYRGAIAALVVHLKGAYRGGAWAVFTPTDPTFYRQSEIRHLLVQTMARLRGSLLLQEGGAAFYTHCEGQPVRLGARVLAAGQVPNLSATVHVEVTSVGQQTPVYQRDWSVTLKAGETVTVADTWQPPAWPAGGYRVVAELRQENRIVDRLSHTIRVFSLPAVPRFIESRDGGFWFKGKPWKAHGINYLPSSGIAIPPELAYIYERWLSAEAYDPEVIDRDLRRIRSMSFNSVSVFLYHQDQKAQNLLDFLARCQELGLHVNLSLRPGTPMEFPWEQVRDMIQFNRLAQNDAVFAYDLAWEPWHGPYDARKRYNPQWARWVTAKYGTLAAAEKAWGVPIPRDAGQPGVPRRIAGGHERLLSLDYLAFLDDLLDQRYGEARRLVRSIDPNHAVSFRMTEAGNPLLFDAENFPYEFYGLRKAVDIWEPEGYGRIGDWETRVKQGRFTVAYARLCDPAKPVIWAEAGYPLYNNRRPESAFPPLDEPLAKQAAFYRDFYRLVRESGSDGVFYWWYPGGHRNGEESDFGILHPDGTDRPVTKVIREEGPRFLAAVNRSPDVWIKVERGSDIRGLFAMYERVKDEFWKAVAAGKTPGLIWGTPRSPAENKN